MLVIRNKIETVKVKMSQVQILKLLTIKIDILRSF
jgi:hypothetical protein